MNQTSDFSKLIVCFQLGLYSLIIVSLLLNSFFDFSLFFPLYILIYVVYCFFHFVFLFKLQSMKITCLAPFQHLYLDVVLCCICYPHTQSREHLLYCLNLYRFSHPLDNEHCSGYRQRVSVCILNSAILSREVVLSCEVLKRKAEVPSSILT